MIYIVARFVEEGQELGALGVGIRGILRGGHKGAATRVIRTHYMTSYSPSRGNHVCALVQKGRPVFLL